MSRISILTDHNEPFPPSNDVAIGKFVKAASDIGLHPIVVEGKQPDIILKTDALFLRTTGQIDHYTSAISEMMELAGKPVIDTAKSIRNGGDKQYIYREALRLNMPIPKTQVLNSIDEIDSITQFPVVVKPVHEDFSRDIFLAEKASDLLQIKKFPAVIQEFLYTPYDWRIGVLEGKAVYACKYYMAKNYWKLIDDRIEIDYNQSLISGEGLGEHECVAPDQIPENIKELAVRATVECYGNDFYGVDIKEKDGMIYLIEINDNPSFDAGVEDGLNDDVYYQVMECFKRRILI